MVLTARLLSLYFRIKRGYHHGIHIGREPGRRSTWTLWPYNYGRLRQHIGPKVRFLGVVKADAYGHGAMQVSRALQENGADYLAVSSIDEAMELRLGGITMPILILGHTPQEQVESLIKNRITQAVTCKAKGSGIQPGGPGCGGTLKIHIKVDTGMSRLGYLVSGGTTLKAAWRGICEALLPAGPGGRGHFHPFRRVR